MAEKKPEDDAVIFSGKCLNDSYKGKEFEGYLKFKPPEKKPEKKSSNWNSIFVWFLVCLGINFIAGDPIGFTTINSDPESSCKDPVVPKSERHKPSHYNPSGDCSH
ncbi:hypothetical protein BCD67_00855 [Oscillatoriales cyanobacterium USR001]|nr:hypothetical protein BCD67_00855 [Oscillatoriales cyanobacterium USR001]